MKKLLFLLPLFCILLLSGNAFAEEEKKDETSATTEIELVESKVEPGGSQAKRKDVIEFIEIAKLLKAETIDEAITALEAYMKKYKNQPVAVYYCAAAYLMKGDTKKTTELLKLAETTNPG